MASKTQQQIKILTAKKEQYFQRIQRLYDNSKNISTAEDVKNFKIRLETFDTTVSELLETLDKINILKYEVNPEFEPDYQLLEVLDELTCHIKSVAKTYRDSNRNTDVDTKTINKITSNLPSLALPKFSGNIQEWPLFIECFNNMIHENNSLHDVDKMHYLINCLSGSALNVCAGIPPTGNNYSIIYQALKDKYDDKRNLANSYLDKLITFKQASSESFNSLNHFLEQFHTAVTALKKVEIPDLTDYILAYLAFSKLSPETQRGFENNRRKSTMPSYEEVVNFVKQQVKVHFRTQSMNNKQGASTNSYTQKNSSTKSMWNKSTNSFVAHTNDDWKCSCCKVDPHPLNNCRKFLAWSPEDRYKFIRSSNLCLNCLAPHKIINCKSWFTCRICKSKHHTLLHFQSSNISSSSNSTEKTHGHFQTANGSDDNNKPSESPSSSLGQRNLSVNCCSITNSSNSSINTTVLLSTAKVNLVSRCGSFHEIRVLVDSCSQANFITLDCCQRLNLKINKRYSSVRGIGTISSSVLGAVRSVIVSKIDSSKQYTLEFLVVDKISDPLPQFPINVASLHHLNNLRLADDDFNTPGPIDGIIGAELFPYLLRQKHVVGGKNRPVAIDTRLGFIVMGSIPTIPDTENFHSFCSTLDPSLDSLVKKFWSVENIPSQSLVDPEDLECEEIFKSSYARDSSGRYTVALPFKLSCSLLGDSYSIALKRFFSLENKLVRDVSLRNSYLEIINDYLERGHMSKVDQFENQTPPCYFIPHHAVFKTDSSSTPVRIVFDASCKGDTNYSLNDLLYTGPKLQTDLLTLLLNFRVGQVAFCADVRQMYRQINLVQDHRRFQKLLWRSSADEPIGVYELNTVAFGVKASPFLALRTLQQLAEDEGTSYPLASSIVKRDMYVDDVVSSVNSVDKAVLAYEQLVSLFCKGGFDLTKWASNSKEFIELIRTDHRSAKIVNFEISSLKILGLQWIPNSDTFVFSLKLDDKSCTKRNILSTVARCYDPLGFIAPIMLLAKLIIKELWILHLGWDDTPPDHIVRRWKNLIESLPLLETFQIPRYLGTIDGQAVTLIGFSDACSTSYGAVVYSRCSLPNGDIVVRILCAKCKVSPIKVLSIPRLELCGAHLLAKLLDFIVNCFNSRLIIERIYALSDSTVALSWIASHPSKLQTFVANRVAQIQSLIDPTHWLHVEGKQNISDCLSRGLNTVQFISYSQWTTGPPWLQREPSSWPIRSIIPDTNLPETKVVSFVAAKHVENLFSSTLDNCSKLSKVLRTVVYVLRFAKLLPYSSTVSVADLNKAEIILVKLIQKQHFSAEIKDLECGKCPASLRYLRPFLDNGLVRVGGRLVNSELDYDSKHPILLPKRDRFVELLVDHFHRSNFHTGPHLVLSLLRHKYWILSARNAVRFQIKKCNICFRHKPKPQIPIMGNLPECRVRAAKAFLKTGVDYAGPLPIIPYRKRGVRSVKAYICLFVCLATKAVHIELVTDLSTPNFLAAFKRFIARRGQVSVIYSDNGTNFIGAKAELNDLYKLLASDEYTRLVSDMLVNQGVEWYTNPPSAPHFGGIWEANVKSLKTHLRKTLGAQLLTYEEMNSLLVQIEAVMNSRPLCVLSSDPADPIALTPSHFLTLGSVGHLPAQDISSLNVNKLDRFQMVDQMVQHFWKRWRLEYLCSLQTRQRWNRHSSSIEVGTIVVLEISNAPPLHWPLGIIEKVYRGADSIVRVVDVRTRLSVLRRPVSKICPLPTQ